MKTNEEIVIEVMKCQDSIHDLKILMEKFPKILDSFSSEEYEMQIDELNKRIDVLNWVLS